MRILIDARKAFDSGIGTYIRCLMPRVISRLKNAELSLLVEPGGSKRHTYISSSRVQFVEIAAAPLGFREQIQLRQVAKNIDLFWATSLAHPLFSDIPMVATVHDVAQLALATSNPSELLVKNAARVYFQSLRSRAQLILFNSEFTQAEFIRCVGRPRSASLITPLGVESEWFADNANQTADPGQRPYVVCIGNLRPHKNILYLLRAFAAVADSLPFDLVLVGRPEGFQSSNPQYHNLISALGKRLRFTGFLPDADLRQYVSQAQALILPSLYEGFGLPALEGMSAGTPVIAAKAAALPEVCGSCASYFDPSSVDSLAQQLLRHATLDSHTKREIVANGIARARLFTWERTASLTADSIMDTFTETDGIATQ